MKSRNELYTEIMTYVRGQDMQAIRAEMAKRYRGVTEVHKLNIEQLQDWTTHLASRLPAKSH